MKLKISRRQSRLRMPALEAYRMTARESLGSARHEVIAMTIHYQSIDNDPSATKPGPARARSPKNPVVDSSETTGRSDRSG